VIAVADVEITVHPDIATMAIDATRPELESLGPRIVDAMVTHHEYTDRTGRLTASFTYAMESTGESTGALLVGSTEFYARYVEDGTSRMAARPFLLPAVLDVLGGG
jgi:HK97 gp10 family phage protein